MKVWELRNGRQPVGLFVLWVLIWFIPVIGSRSVNKGHSPIPPERLTQHQPTPSPSLKYATAESQIKSTAVPTAKGVNWHETDNRTQPSPPSPCDLVPLVFDEETAEQGARLLPYDEKTLLQVSHPVFQVTHGVVPSIVYQVTVEVLPGHEFSLEYWVNGIIDERTRLKRRHQRGEVVELFPASPTSADQVASCSKNSIGGLNRGTSMKLFTFQWYLASHPTPHFAHSTSSATLSSTGSSSPTSSFFNNPSFPTTVVFRLRFRSIMKSTNSVFEQNLSVSVRPYCEMKMNVNERLKLSLNSFRNLRMDNVGLNCTVLLQPREGFGFEFRLTNLSIYGMRSTCKDRFVSVSSVILSSTGQQKFINISNSDEGNAMSDNRSKHDKHQRREKDESGGKSFVRKTYCGKIEDYSLDERSFTFTSGSSSLDSGGSRATVAGDMTPRGLESDILIEPSDRFAILLAINLPFSVKSRETFSVDLQPVSPCQKVRLTGFSGEIIYKKSYDREFCSIAIHVPYGNIITTQMLFAFRGELDLVPEPDSPSVTTSGLDVGRENDTDYSTPDEFKRPSGRNDTEWSNTIDAQEGSQPAATLPERQDEDSKCTLLRSKSDVNQDDEDGMSMSEVDEDYYGLILTATDSVTGEESRWCVAKGEDEEELIRVYRREWESSGNRIQLKFQLKYFEHFHLVYNTSSVRDIVGECEKGWVKVDSSCIRLQETAMSWPRAEEHCQSINSHLVTIMDDEIEATVHKVIKESATYDPSRAYWVGAHDRESEGTFQWTSGLPFIHTNWYPGYVHRGDRGTVEIINAQPNDDGLGQEDCVEVRQKFGAFSQDKNFETGSGAHPRKFPQHTQREETFYWNDRNCETANFFLCEKLFDEQINFACNQTIVVSPGPTSAVIVTSPAYPSAYPDNVVCIATLQTVPGYKIVVQFDEFIMEDSPSCKYDSLEVYETSATGEILPRRKHADSYSPWNKLRLQALDFPIQEDKDKILERICGNWNNRLKLLRYTTETGSAYLHLKFESDFSHHFAGFKAKVWAEVDYDVLKEQEEQCVDQHMQKFGSHCYLFASHPPLSWNNANRECSSMKGSLVSVLSMEEWTFITRNLMSTPHYDKKSIYWLGGFIDHSSQLVWMDRMPFNFTAFHREDLQTISNWKCLSLYWHEGSKGDFAWRLSDCSQKSGYVCKKNTQVETRHGFNRTFSGTGGRLTSPNFPANYYNNLDYTTRLIAPNRTQIVIRFAHLNIEEQEDCLYDYIEIVDRRNGNASRFCGSRTSAELKSLDYVSSSNEVDIVFHSDFGETKSGFDISWRAVDVTSCVGGKTILTGIGTGFPLHEATIYTPNFPHFNLPGLSCEYTIVAPAGQRIWITFQVFEIGVKREALSPTLENGHPTQSTSSSSSADCLSGDHVVIDLGPDDAVPDASSGEESKKLNNEILLCGNLTGAGQETSFLSYHEKMTIRVYSPIGKTGRGLLGKFKAVGGGLNEIVGVVTEPNTSFSLASLNAPHDPPIGANFTLMLTSPPNYVLTIRLQGKFYPKCHSSYVEIRDPLDGPNGTSYMICQPEETPLLDIFSPHKSDSEKQQNINQLFLAAASGGPTDSIFTLQSSYNQLDIKQVYAHGHRPKRWKAQIVTTWDKSFRSKLIDGSDKLLLLKGCSPDPCLNGGKCVSESGRHICRCPPPFTGPFCGLSLCDMNPCMFGDCVLHESSFRCNCHLGYGGARCDRRVKPCDEKPCTGHGECIETSNSSYRCLCHGFWGGPRCETPITNITNVPLSERMLKEPFWLGMITVTVVLGVIGLVWCLKRHFPEKLDKLLNDEQDRNRGISWVAGRSPSSVRIGSSSGIGIREPIPGPSQQSTSPPTSRSFLGRFGIRKPSLLSLSSATSAVSVTACSPHQYENRTFSLDDLLRPTRSMMRTPSPHRRRNYSIQVRRDPAEKQQILQQLVSCGSQSLDGEGKPPTPKPTIAEIIQMSEKRLRLASASSVTSDTTGDKKQSSIEGEAETSFTTANIAGQSSSSMMLTPTSKAEKKVTFARLLDKLAATEMSSSSSCSDISCGEDKMVIVVPKAPERKKDRKGRFRRSKSYNRGRGSETDQDGVEMSSSDTTPDPIYPPRFPSRLCISPTGLPIVGAPTVSSANSSPSNKLTPSKSLTKMASADSLLALFRRFSGSSSAPPSPQYSENEESSAGATPLSTPGSPRNSSLSIRPPAFQITLAEQTNSTIELPVHDSFSQQQNWSRSGQSITLEVPMRDCCLSPIHEVPTPLPTPSHSPAHTPMMQRPRGASDASSSGVPAIRVLISSEDESNATSHGNLSSGNDRRNDESDMVRDVIFPVPVPQQQRPSFPVPIISISVEDEEEPSEYCNLLERNNSKQEEQDEEEDLSETQTTSSPGENNLMNKKLTGETEVIPDVLIHVPPEVSLESRPGDEYEEESESCSTAFVFPTPVRPPRLKREKYKPPPLVFANEILSCADSKDDESPNIRMLFESPNQKNVQAVPALNIEFATPLEEKAPASVYASSIITSPAYTTASACCEINVRPWDSSCSNRHNIASIGGFPLAPPVITINQSSEAESDSDTPVVRKLLRRPNLTFLSPFVGASDRVPSESNLSTSGYSSMASPCPSRCPSVSPLCPSEMEDNCHSSHHHHFGHPYSRRSSLTPATSRRSSLTQRRCSLNATSPLVSMSSGRESIDHSAYSSEGCMSGNFAKSGSLHGDDSCNSCILLMDGRLHHPARKLSHTGFETDSAVEMETDVPLTPGICDTICEETTKIDLLQVPRKNMPKSRSLDMNVSDAERRQRALKGDSLDSKLNSVDPNTPSANFSKFMENVYTYTSILEMPEEPGGPEKKKRLSPVSSRSDSPISELSVGGHGIHSPLTDSDGIYDCPSSEVPNGSSGGPSTTSCKQHQQQHRRTGKRRERRTAAAAGSNRKGVGNQLQVSNSRAHRSLLSDHQVQGVASFGSNCGDDQSIFVNLPSSVTKESGIEAVGAATAAFGPAPAAATSSSHGIRVKSPKRRVRAASFIPSTSSSSQESLYSPRSFGSCTSLTQSDSRTRSIPSTTEAPSLGFQTTSLTLSASKDSSSLNETHSKESAEIPPVIPADNKKVTSSKLSRLRAISNQIRFLRRLEVSLLRKKKSLGVVTNLPERRDSCSWSDSSCDSRCYTSDTDSSSPCESFMSLVEETQKPLLSLTSASNLACRRKRRKPRCCTSPTSLSQSTLSEAAIAHQKRISQYK